MYNPFYENQRGFGGQRGMFGMPQEADTALINDVIEAIILEVHAYNFYEHLAELATTDYERDVINSIQNDEARHYHWFTMILQRLGGNIPEIPIGVIPTDFMEGLKIAIQDELNAASFYQNIAYNAADHQMQMHFMHASHDEQRHASWLQYIMTNMR
jgi:rubrerythrin